MNAASRRALDALEAATVPDGVSIYAVQAHEQWLALRVKDVTASTCSALFGDGAHPYVTALDLWAEKSGRKPAQADTPTMRRGRLMEPVILQMLREDFPDWGFVQANRYYRDFKHRIGCTPDFFAFDPARPGQLGVIDAKSVGKFAFRKGWLDPDTREVAVPLHIAIQISVTAALTGASWGMVAPCQMGDGGFDLSLEEIPLRPGVMPALRVKAAEFWRRVENNEPYPADYNRDAALVAQLYEGDGGPVIDLGAAPDIAALLDTREKLKADEASGTAAARARKVIDTALIDTLGNASGGRLADGRTFTVKVVKRGAYSVAATQYPVLTVKGDKPAPNGSGAPAMPETF